jgi:hypothetical protein
MTYVLSVAAGDGLERDRGPSQEISECDHLVGGQLVEGTNVPERRQDEPTLEAQVEIVGHAPAGLPDEALPKGSVGS